MDTAARLDATMVASASGAVLWASKEVANAPSSASARDNVSGETTVREHRGSVGTIVMRIAPNLCHAVASIGACVGISSPRSCRFAM
jgi:hypothetical protein